MEKEIKKESLLVFETLSKINVNDYVEKKEGSNGKVLSYLSWAWAWDQLKRKYSDATYTIWKDPVTNAPYYYDDKLGYMVYTSITVKDQTYDMWLPVMDNKNRAMKSEPYTYSTKYGNFTVAAATMFDINTTIMRCLVKNIAMFGLGLYIYAGEDVPQIDENDDTSVVEKSEDRLDYIGLELKRLGSDLSKVAEYYHCSSWDEMTLENAENAYKLKCASLNQNRKEVKLA